MSTSMLRKARFMMARRRMVAMQEELESGLLVAFRAMKYFA
jgi:hypothetical protein